MSKKSQKKSCNNRCGGFEIAISKNDLRVKAKCRILEKKSTAGFEEVPRIKPPRTHAKTNQLIQYDQAWCVEFKWKVYGPLACLLDCGYWRTNVLFERMGGGETNFSPEAITQDVGKPGYRYKTHVQISPGALKPGIYRVLCCMQYYIKDGKPGPVAGFHDLGLVKIYEDKKLKIPRQAVQQPVAVENGTSA